LGRSREFLDICSSFAATDWESVLRRIRAIVCLVIVGQAHGFRVTIRRARWNVKAAQRAPGPHLSRFEDSLRDAAGIALGPAQAQYAFSAN
jgi:hypothetical protein